MTAQQCPQTQALMIPVAPFRWGQLTGRPIWAPSRALCVRWPHCWHKGLGAGPGTPGFFFPTLELGMLLSRRQCCHLWYTKVLILKGLFWLSNPMILVKAKENHSLISDVLLNDWSIELLAALGLCCCRRAFSSCRERGLLSSCGARASHCSGFSCCRTWALELQ